MESISLARYLMYENDKSKILEAIYMLDKELKRIHSKNMYVPVMSAETIVYNSDDTFSFKNVSLKNWDRKHFYFLCFSKPLFMLYITFYIKNVI